MRFFSSVCHFMMFLVVQPAEGFLAVATFVRFFSSVCHFMLLSVAHLAEGFLAVATFVRFCPAFLRSLV